MNIILAALTGALKGRKFAVAEGNTRRIGRGSGADIVTGDGMSSRVHCEISNLGVQIVLRDLRSSNGTYLNDERIERALLCSGDRVKVGTTLFEVRGVEGRIEDEADEGEVPVIVESPGKTRMMSPEQAPELEEVAPPGPERTDGPPASASPSPNTPTSLAEFEALLGESVAGPDPKREPGSEPDLEPGPECGPSGHELVPGAEQGFLGRHPLAQNAESVRIVESGGPAPPEEHPESPVGDSPEEDADLCEWRPTETFYRRTSREPLSAETTPAPREGASSAGAPASTNSRGEEEESEDGASGPASDGAESPSEIIFEIPPKPSAGESSAAAPPDDTRPPAALEAVPGYDYQDEAPSCCSCGRKIRYEDVVSGAAKKVDGGYACPICSGTRVKGPEDGTLEFTEMEPVDVETLDEELIKELRTESKDLDEFLAESEDEADRPD